MLTDNSKGIRLGLMTLIPGVVQDNNDPEKLQRVKAVIPGVFDKIGRASCRERV